jgi:hypothetical protein
MKLILYTLLLLGPLQSRAQELFSVPADAEAFYKKAMPAINVKYRQLVQQIATQLKGKDIIADSIATTLRNSGNIIKLGNADIDALVVLVMMEASKDSQEELKSVMMEMKRKNAEKKNVSQPVITKQRQPTPDSLVNDKTRLRNKPAANDITMDSGQQLQSRMDKMVDRRARTNDMISTIMKKISDTQNQIIQNLK